ncbi:YrzI family protein [Brevibacillus migulae]|uniref:YrzI family protein n=1 Tax=Brevibacillus migulae TaxID=1644114 RepID=UPI00106E6B18|nr:YrzI family protein [Brevibacillus migulae]
MQIPMILFTVIIERKKVKPEEVASHYQQQQMIQQLESKRWEQISQLPEYCTRL